MAKPSPLVVRDDVKNALLPSRGVAPPNRKVSSEFSAMASPNFVTEERSD